MRILTDIATALHVDSARENTRSRGIIAELAAAGPDVPFTHPEQDTVYRDPGDGGLTRVASPAVVDALPAYAVGVEGYRMQGEVLHVKNGTPNLEEISL